MKYPTPTLLFATLLLAVGSTLAVAPAAAQDTAPTGETAPALPAWEELTPAQRELLVAPLRERWNTRPQARERILSHAQRWQEMTPEQRKHARRGMHRWERMDPEHRQRMRALFEKMRGMDPEERKALREQWREMTREQRKAWVERNSPEQAD